MSKSYKAFAPATLSNLGSGFDLLGLALDQPGDFVTASFGERSGIHITQITGYKNDISKTKNSALTAVEALLTHLNRSDNIELKIKKGYPHSSGMGSSAASAVAAVIAVNTLIGKPIKHKEELYPFALLGERHHDPNLPADNVAASLLGGVILSHPEKSPIIIPVPEGLHLTVLRQKVNISTIDSRKELPSTVSLDQLINQTYGLSNFILGMYRSNLDLISQGLKDHVIECHRKDYIPNFEILKEQALNNGALGYNISGSGPTVFALCPNSLVAENIMHEWKKISDIDINTVDLFVSKINMEGAHLC